MEKTVLNTLEKINHMPVDSNVQTILQAIVEENKKSSKSLLDLLMFSLNDAFNYGQMVGVEKERTRKNVRKNVSK